LKEAKFLEKVVLKARADPPPTKTVCQKIVDFLLKQTQAKTPLEIAEGAGGNANSTRREVQQLLKIGFLEKEKHAYRIVKLPDPAALDTLPWQRYVNASKERISSDTRGAEKLLAQLGVVDTLTVGGYKYRLENRSQGHIITRERVDKRAENRALRNLIGTLMDEYAKTEENKWYFEFDERKKKIERCLRAIQKGDRGNQYEGVDDVKRLARALFGRMEHGNLVAYEKPLSDWFVQLRDRLKLDDGLTPVAIDEYKRIVAEERRKQILNQLKSDPYLLGDIRDFARKRGEELLDELKKLGMPEDEVNALVAELQPKALQIIYQYWLKEMDWYRKQLAGYIAQLEGDIRETRDATYALNWVEHARQAYEDLKWQGEAVGITQPPEFPWLAKYEAQIRYLAGVGERPNPPHPADNVQFIELEEPLPEAPVTVKVRKRIEGANPGKHLEMRFGKAKPLVDQGLAKILKADAPAPSLRGIFNWEKAKPGEWCVVGRWSRREDAEDFLTDAHHSDFPESEYWAWKKAGAGLAVIHWRGCYWPAVKLPNPEGEEL
jgi:hypothetical protein